MLILHETYDHWSVAALTVTVHSLFLHWIQSVNPIFMLPYIIMDLPIFVIAEWATLLVDIHCPRGGSLLSIPIQLSGLAPLRRSDIAQNL